MTGDARRLLSCLACGSDRLEPVLSLGDQVLANSYRDGRQAGSQPIYELALNRCAACFHCQLSTAVATDLLYRHYLYVSGTTATLRDYFAAFADRVQTAVPPAHGRSVLELACNDGSLLELLRARGYDTVGVDPAENLHALTLDKGLDVRCEYWGIEAAARLARRFDVIVAMNVLAHGPDPLGFLTACRMCLAPGGRIYVQTSQAFMIDRGEFDTIYHEHHSFFVTRSMQALAARAGLRVVAAEHVAVHGTSYLWTLATDLPEEASLSAMLAQEQARGLYDEASYDRFAAFAREVRSRFTEIVGQYRASGYLPVAYGAAAKGNTFLQFAHGGGLAMVVDDNPLKQGLLTPGTDLPIVPATALAAIAEPVLHVVSAWNFRDEIVRRIRAVRHRPADRFLVYFPKLEISQ